MAYHRLNLPVYERISDYLFNMTALTRREARQQWRDSIKEAWNNRCAYCGQPPIDDDSLTELTIDHVRPKSRGAKIAPRTSFPRVLPVTTTSLQPIGLHGIACSPFILFMENGGFVSGYLARCTTLAPMMSKMLRK